MSETVGSARRRVRWAAALGGGVLASAALFSPTVRAVGQSFLEAFRLPRVTAIGLDDQQMAALRDRLKRVQSRFELQSFIGDHVEVEAPAARSTVFTSALEAGRAAGFAVRTPTWLPEGATADTIRATADGGSVRFTLDVRFANEVLDFLDLRDATLPPTLDGQTVTVKFGGRVETGFVGENKRRFSLVQARLPEVALPEGASLTPFGYAYLRMLGLNPAEAHATAAATDWRSTLVVPVPAHAQAFRQVIVRGRPAFLMTPHIAVIDDERRESRQRRRRASETTLLWTEGEHVFILSGALTEQEALTIAGALQ